MKFEGEHRSSLGIEENFLECGRVVRALPESRTAGGRYLQLAPQRTRHPALWYISAASLQKLISSGLFSARSVAY